MKPILMLFYVSDLKLWLELGEPTIRRYSDFFENSPSIKNSQNFKNLKITQTFFTFHAYRHCHTDLVIRAFRINRNCTCHEKSIAMVAHLTGLSGVNSFLYSAFLKPCLIASSSPQRHVAYSIYK